MHLLLPLLLLPAALVAAAPSPASVRHVRTIAGIAEHTLEANGLTILLLPDRSAPVLTFMVTYRVGSRNEVSGTTGATHLLEHLMFKGSRHYHAGNGQAFDTLLDRIGGINNATTWLDRTNYYENIPSRHLALVARLEADRMRHLLLREEDRQLEMTVVRNEYERDENDPAATLDKEVAAAAFLAHPYQHPTIGWRSDIEKVSIAKLREFYDTFYWPDNATVSVIGDFEPATALALLAEVFGPIPRAPHPIPQVYTEEPAQTGPRRVVVRRPGEVGVVQIAYKSPAARHPDQPALQVLAEILGSGKTSRFYRALVDTNLAINATAGAGFFHDPHLFSTTALLAPGVTHEPVEQVLRAEAARVAREGVSAEELTRARAKLRAATAYGRDGAFAIAGQLNEAIAAGDWTLYATLPAALEVVTTADVQRVAARYLIEDQSTAGWFVPPAVAPSATDPATAPATAGPGPRGYRRPGEARKNRAEPATAPGQASAGARQAAAVAPRARRRVVAGIDVVTVPTAIREVVTLRAAFPGGAVGQPTDRHALADLTAALLDQGTVTRDKFAVAALLEQAGATVTFSAGTHTVDVAAKCLRPDLPLVLGLLAEQLRAPRFDPAELAKARRQLAGQFRRELEDPGVRARLAFARAAFPPGHPNHRPAPEDYLADLERTTLEEVRAFHAAQYGPAGARLVAVGDVDDAVLDGALAEGFRGWSGGRVWTPPPPAAAPATARVERLPLPDKTSVALLIGAPSGLRHRDPAHLAVATGTAVLGSGFFSARLLDIIRNREGLTYGIGAVLGGDTHVDGAWTLQGTFGPELLARGQASTLRELRRFLADGVTTEELDAFKVTLTGSFQLGLATTDGLAGALLACLQRGYGPEWIDAYPGRVEALTAPEVNAALRRHLDPDRMITVLAGPLP